MVSWLIASAAGCGPGEVGGRAQISGESASEPLAGEGSAAFRGVLLDPGPRPDFTLTDVNGLPFRFRERTRGKVALLFFGYTNCPDICPVHMAGIAAVLRDLPWELRDRIEVVFVTTDPERDSSARLREWLAGFDSEFVGLLGEIEEVNQIQADLGLPPSVRLEDAREPQDDTAGYEVGHAAQVLAFAPDDRLRLAYPFGTRQTDWKHDLPLLALGPPSGAADETAPAAEPGPD